MNKDWFEQRLRSNYPDEAHDFDADAAWARLQARRQKRRRPFGFWWWGAGLLLTLVGWGLWQGISMNSDSPNRSLAAEHTGSRGDHEAARTSSAGFGQDLQDLQDNRSGGSAARTSLDGFGQDLQDLQDNRSGGSAQNPVNRVDPVENTPTPVHLAATRAAARGGSAQNPVNLVNPVENTLNPVQATPEPWLCLFCPPHTCLSEGTCPRYEGKPARVALVERTDSFGTTNAASTEHTPPTLGGTAANLALLEKTVSLPTRTAAERPTLPSFAEEPLKHRKPKEPRWWIGASAHYGLQAAQRSGTANYVTKRAAEETTLDWFQAGAAVRRRLNSRVFLQTGISFAQWTDARKNRTQEFYTVVDTNYLVARIIRADGTTEDIYAPVELTGVRTVTAERYNRYRHLEVPLLAGISLPVGTHWRLEGAAGPAIGLWSARSGTMLDVSGTGEVPLPQAPYRNSATLAGLARVEWLYAGCDWSAGVGLMGRVSLNAWTSANPAFSEKRHAVGVGLVFRKALAF